MLLNLKVVPILTKERKTLTLMDIFSLNAAKEEPQYTEVTFGAKNITISAETESPFGCLNIKKRLDDCRKSKHGQS